MIERGRHSILGIRVHAVDYDAAVDQILRAARQQSPLAVSALAVHGVMSGALDKTHRHRLNAFDLLLPDGQPVRWALNALYGSRLTDRVYGPRLMLRVCQRAAEEGVPIFLFGGDHELLGALREQLQRRVPRLTIAGARASRFRQLTESERDELVEEIHHSGARILFAGLGCPRQEIFVYEMRKLLRMPLIAVGAAFSFHAGRLLQAPAALQRVGLEWAFRLAVEPHRLWRRYVLLNPLYVSLLVAQALGVHAIDPDNSAPPRHEIRYG
jgi:exopolysaccharide biosynthesis WecB/TagA/CpsF family protein